jgi:hypothetical protein
MNSSLYNNGGNSVSTQQQQHKQQQLKPVDPKNYAFNVGISKITVKRAAKKDPELPQTTKLDPSVGKMEQRLRAIIDLQTFESLLTEVLQPEVKNRSLLVPTHFRARLVKLRKSLAAGKNKKKIHGKTADAVDYLLAELERQLDEESGRNELLEQYRLMILLG